MYIYFLESLPVYQDLRKNVLHPLQLTEESNAYKNVDILKLMRKKTLSRTPAPFFCVH